MSQPSVRDGSKVSDNRGSEAYKRLAIKRWNRSLLRHAFKALPAKCCESCGKTMVQAGETECQPCKTDKAGILKDPMPGDKLRKDGKNSRLSREVTNVERGFVSYRDQRGLGGKCWKTTWEDWGRDAVVVARSPQRGGNA